ncbi:uncharacterized protein N0V89_008014 [Didymosphaeria variabile]|uniref:SAP domain-containing protein n=1 Tax=Didymosphaeria variabile TaxID=1932322 RepID=A0A9W9C865_9PLEO|nr:uncharacterized protein N0V89_008014 [Didymosphaeria variabile]KAJ4349399.1 hypothetical protein N0V89_008014 [Didymosphaeria variabile]
MADYKKLKASELAELLERRGLEGGGTKTEMLSRLVKQDTEESAFEKATSAAIRAASAPTSAPAGGKENDKDEGTWVEQTKSGADRAGAGRKSEVMRRERLEKAKKGKKVGDGGFYGVLGEDAEGGEKEGDVDEEAFVKDLLAKGGMERGYAKTAAKAPEKKGGIIVNMTPATVPMRGRPRTRNERYTSSTLVAANDDDGALSDASTIRADSIVAPKDIPLPKDVGNFEKSGQNGKKRDRAGKKKVSAENKLNNATISDSASVSDSSAAMGVLLLAIFIAVVYLFAFKPDDVRSM